MRPGRRARRGATAVLLAVLALGGPLCGCVRSVDGVPHAETGSGTPRSLDQLEPLILTDVPSRLPRVPDGELNPPAGGKRLEDIATYAADPARERTVLQEYGYRQGWERFWGTPPGAVTSVFVDQFDRRAGAVAYARDLASNDADVYAGMLSQNPPHLPGGCRQLTVEHPGRGTAMHGPAAIVWCAHGHFSVCVTSVADSVERAAAEVRQVLLLQLDRLRRR